MGAYQFANGTVFTFRREGAQVRSRIVGQGPVDDRAELDWSIATAKRYQAQTPAAGSEAALRRLIVGLASNTPPYDEMVPALAQVARENLPALHQLTPEFGALRTLVFKRVEPSGMDMYEAQYANGTREFGTLLQADGRIFAAQ
jgi:hypothetical protein